MTASQYFNRLYRYMVAVVGALLIDVGVIALAGVVGYAVGVWGAGSRGNLGVLDSMFLNAFLAVEIAKALVRTVYAMRYQHLRLLPVTDDIATYWNGWLARLIGWTGYGILIAEPLLKAMFSAAVGQLAGLVLMLGVYMRHLAQPQAVARTAGAPRRPGFHGIFQHADPHAGAHLAPADGGLFHSPPGGQRNRAGIGPALHAKATGQTLVAICIDLILSALMSAVPALRIRLSDSMRTPLPMLEQRVNAYVPPQSRHCAR